MGMGFEESRRGETGEERGGVAARQRCRLPRRRRGPCLRLPVAGLGVPSEETIRGNVKNSAARKPLGGPVSGAFANRRVEKRSHTGTRPIDNGSDISALPVKTAPEKRSPKNGWKRALDLRASSARMEQPHFSVGARRAWICRFPTNPCDPSGLPRQSRGIALS